MYSHNIQNGSAVMAAQIGYDHTPAETIRTSVDHFFSSFAKDQIADSATGAGHRWKIGHDLVIDVPRRIAENGWHDGLKGLGHIVLTDLPTKDGIPIPFLSHEGIGAILVKWGIKKAWLNLSLFKVSVGGVAAFGGTSALSSALHGTLVMKGATFFGTIGVGSGEIWLASYTSNPILLIGGIENIAAGVVSAWKTYSVYVAPLHFFGAGLISAAIGGVVGYLVASGEEPTVRWRNAAKMSARSALLGAAYSVKIGFGLGAVLALVAFEGSRRLAHVHERRQRSLLHCDETSFKELLRASSALSPTFAELWGLTISQFRLNHESKTRLDARDVVKLDARPIEKLDTSTNVEDGFSQT